MSATATMTAPNPTVDWLLGTTEKGFLGSLRFQYGRYGRLTDRQLETVEKIRMERLGKKANMAELIPPAGRYVITAAGERRILTVDHGDIGDRYEGWTFIRHEVDTRGGKPRLERLATKPKGQKMHFEVRSSAEWLPEALAKICANLQESLVAYGHLRGRCGMCGRPLSDPVSVREGIGPICKAKL